MIIRRMGKTERIFNFLIIFAVLVWLVSWYQLRELPDSSTIQPEVNTAPTQAKTERMPFTFNYRDTDYRVVPLADYKLQGLIVTHNNINAWYNYYHDKDSVNLKDICVIWGENIADNIYQKMKFKSGEWTCYFESWDSDTWRVFDPNKLSNNHLLAKDLSLQKKIRNLNIGDQVYLEGMLVSYGKAGLDEKYYRASSMSRTDSGNHSCETFFVEKLEVIKAGKPNWHIAKEVSKYLFLLIIILKILLFFVSHRKVLFSRKINYII
ncbi:hypothetical protein KAJ89_02865 [Candidatus Parcubacteria bacterium]|nr:hypothetical protein [Candidatus Parcubacteria bacterium]